MQNINRCTWFSLTDSYHLTGLFVFSRDRTHVGIANEMNFIAVESNMYAENIIAVLRLVLNLTPRREYDNVEIERCVLR